MKNESKRERKSRLKAQYREEFKKTLETIELEAIKVAAKKNKAQSNDSPVNVVPGFTSATTSISP